MKTVYFDGSVYVPTLPLVLDAMKEAAYFCGHPYASHEAGTVTKIALDDSIDRFRKIMELGSEHNVTFFNSCLEAYCFFAEVMNECDCIFVTSAPYSSRIVIDGCDNIRIKKNAKLNAHGVVDLAHLEELLAQRASIKNLVIVGSADPETGVVQPVHAICAIVKKYKGVVLIDCSHHIGKCYLKVCDADIIISSFDKAGGPSGIVMTGYDKSLLSKDILLGWKSYRVKFGTENFPAIVGLSKFLEMYEKVINLNMQLIDLREKVENGIKAVPAVRIFGDRAQRLPNTVCFSTPGLHRDVQMMVFDHASIALGIGQYCVSGSIDVTNLLTASSLFAMGFSRETVLCASTICFSWSNTSEDVIYFLKVWKSMVDKMRNRE